MAQERKRVSCSEIIKWLIGVGLYYTRLFDLLRKIRQPRIIILSYHRVVDDYFRPQMAVPPAVFEQQMNFIRENFKVISLDEALPFLRGETPLKEDAVVLTFDDGYRDNYTQAFPVLKKYSLPAAIFLTTDFIGTNRRLWWDEIDSLLEKENGGVPPDVYPEEVEKCLLEIEAKQGKDRKKVINKLISILRIMIKSVKEEVIDNMRAAREKPASASDRIMLSWGEVAEMRRKGISFGAHTRSHIILTEVPIETAAKEIVESKAAIEARLKSPVIHFAYPSGEVEYKIQKLVKDNFQSACSTKAGGNNSRCDLFALKRIAINELSSRSPWGYFSGSRFALRIFKGAL